MASCCQLKPSRVSKSASNLTLFLCEARSDAKDFEFFLSQGNFIKVVDTLEKYQQRMVNTKADSGKEFVLFKRQLYQMYEVQNRSIDEHEEFSMTLERQNLRWLYQANLDYIGEMQRVSAFD